MDQETGPLFSRIPHYRHDWEVNWYRQALGGVMGSADVSLDALGPYDQALRDYYFAGKHDAVVVHSDLGEQDELPVSVFFREPDAFFPFERVALEHCRGVVLEGGAGTGCDALALQDRGLTVVAVDIVPAAVAIMRDRGVRHILQGDIRRLELGPVDTLLMVMNGIGFVGTLKGLDEFLAGVGRLLGPGGQILVDSGEANVREPASGAPDLEWPPRTGEYIGEAWIRLEYEGRLGAPFRELYVDFDTLGQHAAARGWAAERIFEEGGGYLARLTGRG